MPDESLPLDPLLDARPRELRAELDIEGVLASLFELTQFAPPGTLCAGACAPTWITVRTNDCKSGDSGGPVFAGDVAFGLTKGGSGGRGARCNFYFYLSTDFLPAEWRLMR